MSGSAFSLAAHDATMHHTSHHIQKHKASFKEGAGSHSQNKNTYKANVNKGTTWKWKRMIEMQQAGVEPKSAPKGSPTSV